MLHITNKTVRKGIFRWVNTLFTAVAKVAYENDAIFEYIFKRHHHKAIDDILKLHEGVFANKISTFMKTSRFVLLQNEALLVFLL